MHQNTINGIVPSSWIFFLLQQKTLHKEELTVSQKERMVKKQIETQAPKHQQKKSQEVAASGSKSSPSKVTTQGNYCFQTPTAKITKVMIQRDCCLPPPHHSPQPLQSPAEKIHHLAASLHKLPPPRQTQAEKHKGIIAIKH